ncbi:MAG: sugar O-acetyltransferase [Clostridiales bacterium]|nr:sugar O-acetyltransferase [Clostridiales bacterium]
MNGDVRLYYDVPDKKLVERKNKLLKKFNYELDDPKEREEVLRRLLGGMGKNVNITPLFFCDYGLNISIGDDFFANYGLVILDCGKVTIGNRVMFAPSVEIYAVGHPIDGEERARGLEYCAPVTIGNDVWIGGRSVINPGVTIGNNVVIGSGSVVTRDIEDGVVAAGNPCRVLRKIDGRDKKYYFKNYEFPKRIGKNLFDI